MQGDHQVFMEGLRNVTSRSCTPWPEYEHTGVLILTPITSKGSRANTN